MYRALRMPSVAFSLVCALAASNTCSKMDSIRFMVLRLGIRVQVGNKNQKISIQKLSQQGKASWHPCLIWVYRPGDSGSQVGAGNRTKTDPHNLCLSPFFQTCLVQTVLQSSQDHMHATQMVNAIRSVRTLVRNTMVINCPQHNGRQLQQLASHYRIPPSLQAVSNPIYAAAVILQLVWLVWLVHIHSSMPTQSEGWLEPRV